MIASPSDVQEERAIISQLIYEWNHTESFHKQIVVLPISWTTHSAPELGAAPQDQINERLVDRCDVLVGIFWTKLGSPTSKEISGSVEEIKRHHAAGKPALVYFCRKPIAPQSIDLAQWEKREEFRKWCEPRGLYQEFDNAAELKDLFSRQFKICLNENDYIQSITAQVPAVESADDKELRKVTINEDAARLLRKASDSRDGFILWRDYIGGWSLSAGGEEIAKNGDPRAQAKWRAHVEKLEEFGLIKETKFGSGIFQVTNEGYEAIERNPEI